jgi:hypothetical protein
MIKSRKKPVPIDSERTTLRRRIDRFYGAFNDSDWEKCFALVDPRLRQGAKVIEQTYVDGLRTFQSAYGTIRRWHTRINLHLDASKNKHDDRPFAFVYVVWQDDANAFHMFRERWVKDGGKWFTRVAGLVVNRQNAMSE